MRLRYCKACDEVYEVGKHFCETMRQKAEHRSRMYMEGPAVIRFEPYVEENMAAEPIEIRCREQRDALCKQYGVTYDKDSRIKNRRKELDVSLDEDIFDEAVRLAESGKVPAGDVTLDPGD